MLHGRKVAVGRVVHGGLEALRIRRHTSRRQVAFSLRLGELLLELVGVHSC